MGRRVLALGRRSRRVSFARRELFARMLEGGKGRSGWEEWLGGVGEGVVCGRWG